MSKRERGSGVRCGGGRERVSGFLKRISNTETRGPANTRQEKIPGGDKMITNTTTRPPHPIIRIITEVENSAWQAHGGVDDVLVVVCNVEQEPLDWAQEMFSIFTSIILMALQPPRVIDRILAMRTRDVLPRGSAEWAVAESFCISSRFASVHWLLVLVRG